MNIQHNMAIRLADLFDSEQLISKENRLLLIFGIEVFLNEFLKVLFAWSCGFLLGILSEVMFATFFLLLLRRYAGGRHFKSNIACFIASVLCMVGAPILADYLLLSLEGMVWIVVVESIILFTYAPFYKKEELTMQQWCMKKILALIVYAGGIVLAACIGEEIINMVLILGGVESVAIIRKK